MESELRDKVLSQIRQGFAEAEQAIRNHPQKTVFVYANGAAAFLEGHDAVPIPNELEQSGLSPADYLLVRRYLVAMGFISAWFHIHRDTARRDKAAQSASLLVAGTGLDSEVTFLELLRIEKLWRVTLSEHGIGLKNGRGMLALLFAIAAGAFWYFA